MANTTTPARTCVLRVEIKCCKGCQTTAKRKLLSVSGVSTVEYNAEQGLLRVTGDVEPTTLLHKLTKWGKKAEIVSDLVDIYDTIPRTPEHYKKKNPIKCLLLRCFGKRSKKTKVEPLGQYRGAWSENGSATPFFNVATPPMVYPPPLAMLGFPSPAPYPPPIFGARQPPPQYSADMLFQSAPPQSPPYFQFRQPQFPQIVNSRLHYPHY